MRRCPECAAELGPWEDDSCRTCLGVDDDSIADRAIRILETAQQPLAWWDVQRHLSSTQPVSDSRNADLADSRQRPARLLGWQRHLRPVPARTPARHPRPRPAAAVYIHASDAALTIDEIRFVLRQAGYRFSAGSLEPALWRVDDLGIFRSGWATQPDGSGAYIFEGDRESIGRQRAAARAMRFSRRESSFHDVVERASRQVDEAIAERRHRLRRDRADTRPPAPRRTIPAKPAPAGSAETHRSPAASAPPSGAFSRQHLASWGFDGFVPLSARAIWQAAVPTLPGSYAVIRGSSEPPSFLEQSVGGHFKGQDPTVSVDPVKAKWVDGATTLYIGRASNLRQRLLLLARYGEGAPVAHWGGRYLWQLADHDRLLVAWLVGPDHEGELVAAFERTYGRLPFANLNRPGASGRDS